MTTKAFLRKQFDQRREFVALRKFECGGHSIVAGQPFDKTMVTARQLRLLYESRYLSMLDAPPVVRPRLTEPTPPVVRRPRLLERLRLKLHEA